MNSKEIERYIYCLKRSGFIVVSDFLSPDSLKLLKGKLLKFEDEIDKFQKKTSAVGLRHGWPLVTTRCLYCISQEVQALAMSELIQTIAHAYLGEAVIRDCLLQTNMPDSRNKQRGRDGKLSFHRDTLWKMENISPSYLHAFVLLSDFTKTNGATFVVPGTHLQREPGYYFKHSDPGIEEEGIEYLVYSQHYFPSAIQLIASAGSLIFLDPMAIHSQGINVTNHKRLLINITFRNIQIQGNPPLLNAKAIAEKYAKVPVRDDFLHLLESDPSLPDYYGPFGYDNSDDRHGRGWEKVIK
jgi:ectoine hydroxylase-related dioxygenase (phytanoyl-CoA dioxygenase family)